jgi:hypothetical protein
MAPPEPSRGYRALMHVGRFTAGTSLVLALLASAACTHRGRQQGTSGCDHPTATASTRRPVAVGVAGAPKVGPLTFHPYPYEAGRPTKMVIHALSDQSTSLTLRGYRCDGRLPLRFWYDHGLPSSGGKLIGVQTATLMPRQAGSDHTGYVMPTSTGRWLIVVSQGQTTLGTLLLDVEQ